MDGGRPMTLNLDTIEAAALADDGWWSVPVLALGDEVRSLRANWRMVTTALGYGDGITEPQIEHQDFVAECERQFAEASEWRESQRWRDECHEAGHPDDEDCYEHDPVLALVALRAKVAAVEAVADALTTAAKIERLGERADVGELIEAIRDDLRAALATEATR